MLEQIRFTIRHLSRDWAYSLTKIVGLTLGITCCLIIGLYVRNELSYDRYHAKGDRIYRIGAQLSFENQTDQTARTPHPLGPILQEEVPEVESFARFRHDNPVVSRNGVSFIEERFYYADPSVFSIFSFSMKNGNPNTALVEPSSIVLTEDAAHKYFGDKDPIGKTVTVGETLMRVTAVMANVPSNSHFVFDFLASYATIRAMNPQQLLAWDNFVTSTYVLMRPGVRPDVADEKLPDFVSRHFSKADGVDRLILTPIADLHMKSRLSGELGPGGNSNSILIFPAVALFILVIACINFINLSVARASERSREIGVRKVLGANRRALVRQFMFESLLLVFVSLGLGLVAVELTLPELNGALDKQIPFPDVAFLLPVFIGSLALGLVASLYPALTLSSFKPILALKGASPMGRVGRFGSFLVIFQYALSTAFISIGLIAARQLEFVRTRDLGFNKSQVAVIRTDNSPVQQSFEVMKKKLEDFPGVTNVSATSHTPARGLGTYEAEVEGVQGIQAVATYFVDADFIPTYEITVSRGRNFSKDFPSDASSAFLVNESAVRRFGWEEPIGKSIVWDGEKRGRVIGVVKDFNVRSLHTPIEPMVLHMAPEYYKYLSVRVQAGRMKEFEEYLKTEWRKAAPDRPLQLSFLDEDFGNQYRSEEQFVVMMGSASAIGIAIACLGLVALASLIVGRRVKEVGIRKVLGGSILGIAGGLSIDFLKLVLLANVISVPAAWFIMRQWLENFAYRVEIGPMTFLFAAIATMFAASLSISAIVLRAAARNPVESLRYE